MKVLFVCEGNMMRSQMAEAFYNQLSNTNDATSAGAIAEKRDSISKRAIEVMDEVGIDTRFKQPIRITPEMIDAADKIILFPTEFMPDYATNSSKAMLWDIADPHYNQEKGMIFVREVRDEIQKKVKDMLKT